jgi:hypothetical protein
VKSAARSRKGWPTARPSTTPAEKSRAEVFFRLDGFITATVGSTRGYALRDIVESLEAQAAKWRRRLEAEA